MSLIRLRIKEKCAEQGITISDLARKTGMQNENIHKIISGRNPNPTIKTIFKMANALNCTIDEFVETKKE